MVNNAIKGLDERRGSSLQAIKKYIAANYKADANKVAPFIKKYLKSEVAPGSLVQTKGKGASGSFKLASATVGYKKENDDVVVVWSKGQKTPVKRVAGEKAKTRKKATSPKGKKASTENKATTAAAAKPKKAIAEYKKTVASKASSATSASKTKSPSKAKKTNKEPTKKPKMPKPKTVKAAPASASSPKAIKAASPKKKK